MNSCRQHWSYDEKLVPIAVHILSEKMWNKLKQFNISTAIYFNDVKRAQLFLGYKVLLTVLSELFVFSNFAIFTTETGNTSWKVVILFMGALKLFVSSSFTAHESSYIL